MPLQQAGNVVTYEMFGTYRSLVARFLGVEEVVGSNPVVPTIWEPQSHSADSGWLFLILILTNVCQGWNIVL